MVETLAVLTATGPQRVFPMKAPRDRTKKAERLRTVAVGYRILKKNKADVYSAAADALELVEKRAQERKNRVADKGK
jgi:hypothetical protein